MADQPTNPNASLEDQLAASDHMVTSLFALLTDEDSSPTFTPPRTSPSPPHTLLYTQETLLPSPHQVCAQTRWNSHVNEWNQMHKDLNRMDLQEDPIVFPTPTPPLPLGVPLATYMESVLAFNPPPPLDPHLLSPSLNESSLTGPTSPTPNEKDLTGQKDHDRNTEKDEVDTSENATQPITMTSMMETVTTETRRITQKMREKAKKREATISASQNLTRMKNGKKLSGSQKRRIDEDLQRQEQRVTKKSKLTKVADQSKLVFLHYKQQTYFEVLNHDWCLKYNIVPVCNSMIHPDQWYEDFVENEFEMINCNS